MDIEVGDKVRATQNNDVPKGTIGEVVDICGSRWPYEVVFNEGQDPYPYSKDEIELVEKNNMDNTDNFVPFYVEVDGLSHSKLLQEIAFEEGFGWMCGGKEVLNYSDPYFIFHIIDGGEPSISIGKPSSAKHLENPTLQEFRDALNGHYFEPEPEPIEILGHEVEIFENTVVVGCREFSSIDLDVLYELAVDAKDRQEKTIDGVDFEVDSKLLINGEEVDPDLIIEVFDRFNE
jgi:hypothetical protein